MIIAIFNKPVYVENTKLHCSLFFLNVTFPNIIQSKDHISVGNVHTSVAIIHSFRSSVITKTDWYIESLGEHIADILHSGFSLLKNKIKYMVKIQNQCQSFILQDVKKGYCRKVVTERKKALALETADNKSNQFLAHSRFILFHLCTVETNGTYGFYQYPSPSHYI